MLDNSWKKSTRSNGSGGNNCVEVRSTIEHVLVRDTKDKGRGATLTFTKSEWAAFIDGVKTGEFDI
jgi:hypothetical protein